jgi:hypothetical protein
MGMKLMPIPERFVGAAFVAAGLAAACTTVTQPTASMTQPTASTTISTITTTSNASTCATADGVNDACACDADAHSYCAGFYGANWQAYARANGYTTASWKYGLLDCLGKHDVSPACQTSLARREALNTQMMNACGAYCRGTAPQPGAEPCVDRLKSIYDSLDTACRTALDAHEAAKPLEGHVP